MGREKWGQLGVLLMLLQQGEVGAARDLSPAWSGGGTHLSVPEGGGAHLSVLGGGGAHLSVPGVEVTRRVKLFTCGGQTFLSETDFDLVFTFSVLKWRTCSSLRSCRTTIDGVG